MQENSAVREYEKDENKKVDKNEKFELLLGKLGFVSDGLSRQGNDA